MGRAPKRAGLSGPRPADVSAGVQRTERPWGQILLTCLEMRIAPTNRWSFWHFLVLRARVETGKGWGGWGLNCVRGRAPSCPHGSAGRRILSGESGDCIPSCHKKQVDAPACQECGQKRIAQALLCPCMRLPAHLGKGELVGQGSSCTLVLFFTSLPCLHHCRSQTQMSWQRRAA